MSVTVPNHLLIPGDEMSTPTPEDDETYRDYLEVRLHDSGFDYYREMIAQAEQRGRIAEAEACAKICWSMSDELSDRDDMTSEQGMAQQCASAIRERIATLKKEQTP